MTDTQTTTTTLIPDLAHGRFRNEFNPLSYEQLQYLHRYATRYRTFKIARVLGWPLNKVKALMEKHNLAYVPGSDMKTSGRKSISPPDRMAAVRMLRNRIPPGDVAVSLMLDPDQIERMITRARKPPKGRVR